MEQALSALKILDAEKREFSTALPAGQSYSMLPRTMIVSIIGFDLFDCTEFHSFFQPLEVTRHTLLSDKMGFHFFKLRKLPDDVSETDALLLWLSLFRAETEEDLEKSREWGPIMEKVVDAYYAITASPEFCEVERLREKARHDEAQALYHAEQKGKRAEKFEIAPKMLRRNRPIDEIIEDTGLTHEDIKRLQATR